MGLWQSNSYDSIIGWNPHYLHKASNFTYKHSRPVRRAWKAIKESPKRLRQAVKRKLITEPRERRAKQRQAIAERRKWKSIKSGTYENQVLAQKEQEYLRRQGYKTEILSVQDDAGNRQYEVYKKGEPARLSKGEQKEIKKEQHEVVAQVKEATRKESEESGRQKYDEQVAQRERENAERKRLETLAIQQEAQRLERERVAEKIKEDKEREKAQFEIEELQKRLEKVGKRYQEIKQLRRKERVTVSAPIPVSQEAVVVGAGEPRQDRLTRRTKCNSKRKRRGHTEKMSRQR